MANMLRIKKPEKIVSYFKADKWTLLVVTVTGIVYNIGLTAGPVFEGRLAQCLYDIMKKRAVWQDMLRLALLYIVIILVVQVARALKRFYVRRFANNTSRSMRTALYNSIVHMTKQELEKEVMGSVMTKAISDVDACVEGMRKLTTEVFDTGIAIVAYLVTLCIYDVRLALISCAFIPFAYLIANKAKVPVARYNGLYKKDAGVLNRKTLDLIGNDTTYRVFGLEKDRAEAYEETLVQYERSAVRAGVWESALQPLYYVISMCGAVLIIYFGSRNVLGTGWASWDVGMFTAFFSCFAKLSLKSSKAAKLFNNVQKATVSWKRIRPMFRPYVDGDESEDRDTLINENSLINEIKQKITLTGHNISVFYDGQEPLVTGMSFDFRAGDIIGITGEVASGKSAIGKIFTDEACYTGSFMLNNKELSEMTRAEKKACITYMGHDSELLSTSVLENIVLKDMERNRIQKKRRPQSERKHQQTLTGTEYNQAAACLRMTRLDEEVDTMEDGLKTKVGDAGVRLSGGQQARLALARSLYHRKELLVLDDPFSAVDRKTEDEIFRELQTEAADSIVLLISHRLHLFSQMHHVIFLHDGKASVSDHETLMKEEPMYRSLCELQLSEEERDLDAGGGDAKRKE